jgi:hypothetical protein
MNPVCCSNHHLQVHPRFSIADFEHHVLTLIKIGTMVLQAHPLLLGVGLYYLLFHPLRLLNVLMGQLYRDCCLLYPVLVLHSMQIIF